MSYFDTSISITSSKAVGSQVKSPEGTEMMKLERMMSSHHKKRSGLESNYV